MANSDIKKEALDYHRSFPAGKVGIKSTKALKNKEDLSLAYTPGVGAPCEEIAKNTEKVWEYTNRGNSVAVISDGTAVLGLGNIGPEAGLPVMEGKAVLFKKFADIDAYPICVKIGVSDERGIATSKIKDFISAISCLEPSFGGINLEDIAGPDCFEIQRELDKKMNIPVFHDDQDGTAVIIVAGLLNALELTGRNIEEIKVVISGAGAAGIACARLLTDFGLEKKQIHLCDSKGLITAERTDINEYKREFAQPTLPAESTSSANPSLSDAVKNADVFIGVSAPGILTEEMVKTMNQNPIVFAAANPVPEIMPDIAKKAGAKIVATGRSDFPNQVNNVLGFPGIFRGALDTRSSSINKEMKMAAAKALSSLAKEPIDEETKEVLKDAYPEEFEKGVFDGENPLSKEYIIPKPFDPRVVPKVARLVAEAAAESGVAGVDIGNADLYEEKVHERIKAGN